MFKKSLKGKQTLPPPFQIKYTELLLHKHFVQFICLALNFKACLYR